MAGLDFILFGYRIIYAEDGYTHRLATHLYRLAITSTELDGGFAIREADYKRFSEYAKGRIRYTSSELLGIPGKLKKKPYILVMILSLFIGFLLTYPLTTLVWDLRVSSDEYIEEERVISALREVGFGEGSSWHTFDKEHIEAELLAKMPEIAWISINRSGTVAYVELRIKKGDEAPPTTSYEVSNIIAAKDGVIDEIIVESGVAMVAVGDVVRAGDILISGVIETEYGTILTEARGSVSAHHLEKIEMDVKREERLTEYDVSRVGAAKVTILGFNINIFKNYGNLDSGYDIIEETERLTLFGKRLPLSLTRSFIATPYEVVEIYTDAELPVLAEARCLDELDLIRGERDLIKLSTSGEYTSDGYRLSMSAVFSGEIGRAVPIKQ